MPITPGSDGVVENEADALKTAKKIGYPVMIKASAGGGGRGMRAAHNDASLIQGFHAARAEAEKAFGKADVYFEKLVENPRHIEFQIIADSHGHTMHLGERDCSIQRRNQKIVEEAPSPFLDESLRKAMGKASVKLAEAVGLPERRDDGIPRRRKGQILLHGDEHAHPGGALRDGRSLRL